MRQIWGKIPDISWSFDTALVLFNFTKASVGAEFTHTAPLCCFISCEAHILYMFSLDGPASLITRFSLTPGSAVWRIWIHKKVKAQHVLMTMCSPPSFIKLPWLLLIYLLFSRLMQTIIIMTLSPPQCYDFLLTAQLLWLGTHTLCCIYAACTCILVRNKLVFFFFYICLKKDSDFRRI